MSLELDAIWDQIYDSRTESEDGRVRILNELLSLLEAESNAHPSADVSYAIGYLCYVHPDKSEWMQNKLLESLFKSIKLDPRFASPKLLLGHYYYDRNNYRAALGYFEEAAKGNWSDYYSLVIQEMILCCMLSLHDVRYALSQLEMYVSRCLKSNPDDVFPDQLFKCCCRVFSDTSDIGTMATAIELLNKLASGIGQESVFRDDLAKLRGMVDERGRAESTQF